MNATTLILFWLMELDDDPSWWIIIPIGGALIAIGFISREIMVALKRRRTGARVFNNHGGALSVSPAFGKQTQLDIHAAGKKLRSLQRKLSELDATNMTAATCKEAVLLCEKYLAGAQEAIEGGVGVDVRAALRSGIERVTVWHKQHLLVWARLEAQDLMQEARRRVRVSDKIETAGRALEVINEALRRYPRETELLASANAVTDLIASIKIGHWVELAERAAFRGKYARALARYQDAMFYLARAEMSESARTEASTRLTREIVILRARMASGEAAHDILECATFSDKSRQSPTNQAPSKPMLVIGSEDK